MSKKKTAPRPKSPNTTPITPIRFTPGDLAIFEAIRTHHGLPNLPATLRMLGVAEFKRLNPKPAPKRKARP